MVFTVSILGILVTVLSKYLVRSWVLRPLELMSRYGLMGRPKSDALDSPSEPLAWVAPGSLTKAQQLLGSDVYLGV